VSARTGQRTDRLRRALTEIGFVGAGDGSWRERAACAGTDPELFYPVGTGAQALDQVAEATQVCAGCPVRQWCLADVMAAEDPALRWGVSGGLSSVERAQLFAQRRDQHAREVA
jgi:WhiB family redox-sensing transcriptional regulator